MIKTMTRMYFSVPMCLNSLLEAALAYKYTGHGSGSQGKVLMHCIWHETKKMQQAANI